MQTLYVRENATLLIGDVVSDGLLLFAGGYGFLWWICPVADSPLFLGGHDVWCSLNQV